jgi:hypothetical protein
MLPPSPRDFKDIYVVFELMETDLHQVRDIVGLLARLAGKATSPCYKHGQQDARIGAVVATGSTQKAHKAAS